MKLLKEASAQGKGEQFGRDVIPHALDNGYSVRAHHFGGYWRVRQQAFNLAAHIVTCKRRVIAESMQQYLPDPDMLAFQLKIRIKLSGLVRNPHTHPHTQYHTEHAKVIARLECIVLAGHHQLAGLF